MTDQLSIDDVGLAARDRSRASGQPHRIEWSRSVQVAAAILALIVLFPLMLGLWLALWITQGGPVLFGHTRVGRMGESFRCWKFRTMVADADRVLTDHLSTHPEALAEWRLDHKLRRDPRITAFGQLLRASSLDELPQLWNVIVGDMNLVGPRPIVFAEVDRYKADFVYYCQCRPGITGLWQISGRNDLPYDQRVALDVRYAKIRSFWLDCKIILATIPAVLRRTGSY